MTVIDNTILDIYRKQPCKVGLPTELMENITYSLMKRNPDVIWNIAEIFHHRLDILQEYLNDTTREIPFKTKYLDYEPMHHFIDWEDSRQLSIVFTSRKLQNVFYAKWGCPVTLFQEEITRCMYLRGYEVFV